MPSVHAALFDGLPAPKPGVLTLYVFGPGFGESQVVALPDGKWMVIDSCVLDGVNLPLELLRHLDISAIDLLAVTHADLDHHQGLTELLANMKVRHLWRYPGFQTARELLILLEKTESDPRFTKLLRAHEAMLPLIKSARGDEAAYGHRWWPKGASYQVTCLAPCSTEKVYEFTAMAELIKRLQRGSSLTTEEKRHLMGRANRLSLALIIWWNDIGILLGGDIESEAAEDRGWKGILANLREDEDMEDRGLRLIRGLRLVKASHHGSKGAFCEEAWTEHSAGGPVEFVIVTRFNRGENPPPHPSGLDPLRRFATKLALTSMPKAGWSVVTDADWVQLAHPSGPGSAACVAITLAPASTSHVALSSQAGLFTPAAASVTLPSTV